MTTEENKAAARRLIEEVFNKRNLALMDELVDANFVQHGSTEFKGRDSFKGFVNMQVTAFPDMKVTAEDTIAEGDKTATRITIRGTHQGELMGIAPTGKQITMTGIVITRFAGDKQVESWIVTDNLGMMQQLGVVPLMEQK